MLDQTTALILAAVIAAVAALLGSLIGGIALPYLTHRLATKAERGKIVREKIEEIYLLTDKVKLWLDVQVNNLLVFVDREPELKNKDVPECPDERLMMLVKLYVPELKKSATEFCNCIDKFNSLVNSYTDYRFLEAIHEDKDFYNRVKAITTTSNSSYYHLMSSIEKLVLKI